MSLGFLRFFQVAVGMDPWRINGWNPRNGNGWKRMFFFSTGLFLGFMSIFQGVTNLRLVHVLYPL